MKQRKKIQDEKVIQQEKESKKIKVSEYGPDGMKNLWHFLMSAHVISIQETKLLQFLTTHKVSLEDQDKRGNYPLFLLIQEGKLGGKADP